MTGEYISINGKLLPLSSCGRQLRHLMDTNYTYRDILTLGQRPLQLVSQLKLIELSCESLYGLTPRCDTASVSADINALLYRNNAAQGGNIVRLTASPNETSDGIDICLFYEGPTMYPGYSLWHKQLKAIPLTYEIPFPTFRTSSNLSSHSYSQQYARRKGYDGAIAVNYRGAAVSYGEHPLFCIKGQEVYTADAENTVPQSVERLLGIEVCSLTGFTVQENAVSADELSAMDEVFSFSTTGIIPLAPAGSRLLSSSSVKVMERHLQNLADHNTLL